MHVFCYLVTIKFVLFMSVYKLLPIHHGDTLLITYRLLIGLCQIGSILIISIAIGGHIMPASLAAYS